MSQKKNKQEPPQMNKDKVDKRAQALRENLKKRKKVKAKEPLDKD